MVRAEEKKAGQNGGFTNFMLLLSRLLQISVERQHFFKVHKHVTKGIFSKR